MAYTPSYRINIEKRDVIDQTALGNCLDYLELESIRQRSQLTEEEADTLAAEIDRSVWENIKAAFVEA